MLLIIGVHVVVNKLLVGCAVVVEISEENGDEADDVDVDAEIDDNDDDDDGDDDKEELA